MARCDSYAPGNCTWGVCELAPWLPEGLGNAKDWAYNAILAGLGVVDVVTVGAVVVYGADPAYSDLGHVALVTAIYPDGSFEVQEMNAVGFGVYDFRRSNRFDVLGFILPPGVEIGNGAPPPGTSPGPHFDGLALAWSQLAAIFNQLLPDWAGQVMTAASRLIALTGG